MDSMQIVLVDERATFIGGSLVQGTIHVKLRDSIRARCVLLQLVGKAFTRWTETETHTGVSTTITYSCEEFYANKEVYVWRANSASEDKLAAGSYSWPFALQLPPMAPPSFEGSYGHVRYHLRLKIDRVWHPDNTLERALSVGALFDLRSVETAARPLNSTLKHTLGRLWFKHGTVYLNTNILKSGFAIGESIPICIDIDNRSERDIERARVQLIQTITYRGARHGARFNFGAGAQNLTHMHVRTGKKVVAQNEEALCVHKEKTGRYTTSLVVPAIMPTFNASVPIQVSYELEIKITAHGTINNSMCVHFPLLIGTTPAQNTHDVAASASMQPPPSYILEQPPAPLSLNPSPTPSAPPPAYETLEPRTAANAYAPGAAATTGWQPPSKDYGLYPTVDEKM